MISIWLVTVRSELSVQYIKNHATEEHIYEKISCYWYLWYTIFPDYIQFLKIDCFYIFHISEQNVML